MKKLSTSKNTEASAVAIVWNMAVESLAPNHFEYIETALRQLCETRNIPKEALAEEQIVLSGKRKHFSDCETSNSPAYVCGPCSCDA